MGEGGAGEDVGAAGVEGFLAEFGLDVGEEAYRRDSGGGLGFDDDSEGVSGSAGQVDD